MEHSKPGNPETLRNSEWIYNIIRFGRKIAETKKLKKE